MIKVEHLSRYFPLFKDKIVVDIGCNAGVISEMIAKYAEKVFGIEKDKEILDYSDTVEWIVKLRRRNVKYINSTIGEFLKKNYDFNASWCSNALYYFSNEEIELIGKKLFPKCDLIIFVSYEPKPDLGNNDKFLSKWQNIEAWLKEHGFKTEVKDKELKWVTIIGKR